MKKLLATIALVLCFAVMFSTVGFAAEYVNFSGEIEILTDYAEGSLLIGTADSGDNSTISALDEKYDFIEWDLLIADTRSNGSVKSIYQAKISEQENIASLCYDIENESGVLYAEPDYIAQTQSEQESNGVSGDELSGSNCISPVSWHLDDMGFIEMQNYIEDNNICLRPITVAVFDSGADVNNPTIRSKIKTITVDGETKYGVNTTTPILSYDVLDDYGHGTSVISVLACGEIKGRQMGINPYVNVFPIKVFGRDSDDANEQNAMVSSIIRGLDCITGDDKLTNIDIISMSLGFYNTNHSGLSTEDFNSLEFAIELATNENIIVVSAAGNDNKYIYNDELEYESNYCSYPAAYPNVIGVMGYSVDRGLWNKSNFGQAKYRNDEDVFGYDLIAPSDYLYGYSYSFATESFELDFLDATSFACPLAVGTIAYYLSLLPEEHFVNTNFSSIKEEIISIFSLEKYIYEHEVKDSSYTEMVPTVNLIDVLNAVDENYTVPKQIPENITYEFSLNEDNSLTLNINAIGDIPDFLSRYNTPWYKENALSVSEIIITGNVTTVGNYAFCGFSSVKSVQLPETVIEIGEGAFMLCTDLDEIDLTKVKSIGCSAFENAFRLTFIKLDNIVKLGAQAFMRSNYMYVVNQKNEILRYDKLIIKSNLTEIGYNCFEGIENMYCYKDSYFYQNYINNSVWSGNLYFLPEINSVENSTCVIDYEKNLIYGLDTELTLESLLTNYIDIAGTYSIEYGKTNSVGTGFKFHLLLSETDSTVVDTYTVVIFGDLNGDGKIDVTDLSLMNRIMSDLVDIDENSEYYIAGDLTNFGDGMTQEDLEALSLRVSCLIDLMQTPNEGGYEYENEE